MKINDFGIKTFTQKEINEACEINPNLVIKKHKVEDLEYITIENFLKNPEKLKEFIKQFPTVDRYESINEDKEYIENHYNKSSKAPGIQQSIPVRYLSDISNFIHHCMIDYNFCRYNYDVNLWDFYTNFLDPNITSFSANHFPHVDPFTYASNIYLTEVEDTGTQFFKYKIDENEYYNTNNLVRNPKHAKLMQELTENYREKYVDKFNDWQIFTGCDFIEQYHFIPAKYNCVTIYKGCFWHAIKYNQNSNSIRYSLVGALK